MLKYYPAKIVTICYATLLAANAAAGSLGSEVSVTGGAAWISASPGVEESVSAGSSIGASVGTVSGSHSIVSFVVRSSNSSSDGYSFSDSYTYYEYSGAQRTAMTYGFIVSLFTGSVGRAIVNPKFDIGAVIHRVGYTRVGSGVRVDFSDSDRFARTNESTSPAVLLGAGLDISDSQQDIIFRISGYYLYELQRDNAGDINGFAGGNDELCIEIGLVRRWM